MAEAAVNGELTPTVDLTNVTIINNATGIRLGAPWTATVANTVVGNHTNTDCVIDGTLTSAGNNLDEQDDCGFDAAGDKGGTNFTAVPVLADNGGPTRTYLPPVDSPLIDMGLDSLCPANDQRDVGRPVAAACDIGAVEVSAPVATDDAVTTAFETALLISPLDNDTWPDGGELDPTTLSVLDTNGAGQEVETALLGTTIVNADPVGTITYVPPTGFSGTDTFDYEVCDATGVFCATATVTVTVEPAPPTPEPTPTPTPTPEPTPEPTPDTAPDTLQPQFTG